MSRLSKLIVCVGCAALASAAYGVDASQDLADLDHLVLHPRDGAPSDIRDLAQTTDGFLWIATGSGLLQYDGVKFRRYLTPAGKELPDPDIVSLFATSDGGLWATTVFRHVYFIKDGSLTSYGAAEGIPRFSACGVTADSTGHVWIGSPDGVFRLHGSNWVDVPQADGTPVPAEVGDCVKADGAGNVWAVGSHDAYMLPRGGSHFQVMRRAMVSPEYLALDADGQPWVAGKTGFFSLTDAQRGVSQPVLDSLGGGASLTTHITSLDRFGMAWAIAGDRYLRMPASWVTRPVSMARSVTEVQSLLLDRRQGMMDPQAWSWLEDSEGDAWSATSFGLERFRSTNFRRPTLPGGVIAQSAIAVSPTGTLWLAGRSGLFRRDPGREFVSVGWPGNAADDDTGWLTVTRGGRLYIGGSNRLDRLDGSVFKAENADFGQANFNIHGLAEDDGGKLWASVMRVRGVFIREDGHWVKRSGRDGVPDGTAMSLVPGAGGRMWLGYPDNLLAIVDGNHARVFKAAQGLDVGTVLTMLPQGDKAWIGGSNGLDYFDGERMHAIANVHGLAMTSLSGMVMTPDGDLWLNVDAGVQRIPAQELAAVARDPAHRFDGEFFDAHDGIEGSPATIVSLPSVVRSGDGLLWFRTSNGLFWIDPLHIHRNAVAPRAFVMNVRANGVDHLASPFELPAGTASLQVDYTTPLLSMPDRARFRYRMRGVDAEWQDAGARRQAFYTNLAPGTYQFDVMAANESGVWSQAAASASIVIVPAYWQTTWFRTLVVLAAAIPMCGAGAAWYRFRIRRLEWSLQFEARLKQDERERIARDLHDTLLQNMHALVWRFHAIARQMKSDDPSHQDLGDTLLNAERALNDGRDSIMGTSALTDDGRTFIEQLREIGTEWSNSTGTAFDIGNDTPERPVLQRVASSMRWILSEALANAFRHAGASKVSLRLRFDPDGLCGEVVDDGQGMSQAQLRARREGHMGLRIMQDRARMLGARIHIDSSPGNGTRVTVRLSADRAYASSGWSHWFLSKMSRTR